MKSKMKEGNDNPQTKIVKVSSLTLHPKLVDIYNRRSLEDLKESISKDGVQSPLVINQHGQIIDGAKRFECLKALNIDEVSVQMKHFENQLEEAAYFIFTKLGDPITNWEMINEAEWLHDIFLDHELSTILKAMMHEHHEFFFPAMIELFEEHKHSHFGNATLMAKVIGFTSVKQMQMGIEVRHLMEFIEEENEIDEFNFLYILLEENIEAAYYAAKHRIFAKCSKWIDAKPKRSKQ